MSCPKCKSTKIVKAGKYQIKRMGVHHRWRCKNCNHHFIVRTLNYRKKIPVHIRDKILKLYKTKKLIINKYDNLKKQTYSTREIAEMLNLSKAFVASVIKNKK